MKVGGMAVVRRLGLIDRDGFAEVITLVYVVIKRWGVGRRECQRQGKGEGERKILRRISSERKQGLVWSSRDG